MKQFIIIMLLLILFAGCRQVYTGDQLHFVPKGAKVQTVEGEITTKEDCILMTEFYFNELFEMELNRY